MNWFVRLLERISCAHDVYVIDPDAPGLFMRCAVCGKSKRI